MTEQKEVNSETEPTHGHNESETQMVHSVLPQTLLSIIHYLYFYICNKIYVSVSALKKYERNEKFS